MEFRFVNRSRKQHDPALAGGYMLHSPQARLVTAKLAFGQQLFTILIAVLLAFNTDHFSLVTALVITSCLALLPVVRFVHWQTLPPLAFVPYLWLAAGLYVVMALDFHEPDVLLSFFTTATLLASAFWYKRWLMILQLCALAGAFAAASLVAAGGDGLAAVLLSMPLMALFAIRMGHTSNHYLCLMLRRQRFRATVRSLMHALNARDGYTAAHSEVALKMAVGVAEQLGLDQ